MQLSEKLQLFRESLEGIIYDQISRERVFGIFLSIAERKNRAHKSKRV